MSKKVLVTGGAGFIGSHLTRQLLLDGHTVSVFDNLSSGRRANLEGLDIELTVADLRDEPAVAQVVKGMDWVFHLGAMVSVAESMADPLTCYRVNLDGSLNVLQAAREAGVERVVLSSSCAVYGDLGAPAREDSPVKPISPYSASKLAMESAAWLYTQSFDLPTVCLRYFNVYGPGQSVSSDYAAAIPTFIRQMSRGEAITIDGDGAQTRDFVHVDDAVRANILAAATETGAGATFNIGSGQSVKILEVVELLQRIFPEAAAPAHGPARPGDIRSSAADLSQAERTLGYRPEIDLQTGLTATVEWLLSKEINQT